jgi:nicotinamide-nucleotide amidase
MAMYDTQIINRIKNKLISFNETLAIAESVTSGHLQAAVSLAEMATEFFQGGTTTYNVKQKTSILQIDPVHALSCNCVSEKVASEMAIGAAKLFKSDWAIAITGYAAPVPELGIQKLFAYWAAAHRGEIRIFEKISADNDDPLNVQVVYTNHVLRRFLEVLESIRQ